MNSGELIFTLFSFVFAESIIFSEIFGADTTLIFTDKPKRAFTFGASLLAAAVISNVITYPLYSLLLAPKSGEYDISYLRTVLFVGVTVGVTSGLSYTLRRFRPRLLDLVKPYLPYLYSNGAVLGIIISYSEASSFGESLTCTLLCALSAVFAMALFADIRSRISSERQPAALRGAPSVLIAAGLIAMIFSGLTLI